MSKSRIRPNTSNTWNSDEKLHRDKQFCNLLKSCYRTTRHVLLKHKGVSCCGQSLQTPFCETPPPLGRAGRPLVIICFLPADLKLDRQMPARAAGLGMKLETFAPETAEKSWAKDMVVEFLEVSNDFTYDQLVLQAWCFREVPHRRLIFPKTNMSQVHNTTQHFRNLLFLQKWKPSLDIKLLLLVLDWTRP